MEKKTGLGGWADKDVGTRNLGSLCYQAFAGSLGGEESACDAGDLSLIPGSGRSSGGGNGNPLQCSCLEKSHGQRSLAGYSPWGHKELDMTEQLILSLFSLFDNQGRAREGVFSFFFSPKEPHLFVYCHLFIYIVKI